jgi:hypothetical protein
VYERIRSAQVLADLKESNSLNAAAWDDLTQDIPYQKGTLFYYYFMLDWIGLDWIGLDYIVYIVSLCYIILYNVMLYYSTSYVNKLIVLIMNNKLHILDDMYLIN